MKADIVFIVLVCQKDLTSFNHSTNQFMDKSLHDSFELAPKWSAKLEAIANNNHFMTVQGTQSTQKQLVLTRPFSAATSKAIMARACAVTSAPILPEAALKSRR